MVDVRLLMAFVVASALLSVVPGPSVLFVISRGVTLGRKAALLTVLGNETGVMVQVLVVAVGLGAVLERSAVLFDAIRFAGAAYLVYLGVQAIRHRRELSTVLDATATRPRRHIFREGFVVGVSNPKILVFFTAVLPQFVDPDAGPVPVQLFLLGTVFALIALLVDSCWAMAAGTARAWLSGRPHRLERLGGASGLVIIGLGARLVLTGRKD
jgi:threonine/homoserine/homoserine lactone efflux protein